MPPAPFRLPKEIAELNSKAWSGRPNPPVDAHGPLFDHATDAHVGNQSGQKVGELPRQSSPESGSHPSESSRIDGVAPLRGGAVLRWQTADDGVFLLGSRGGSVAPPERMEHLADLAELSKRIPAETAVGYRGCDRVYHYFCAPTGAGYCLPRRAWSVTTMPVTLGFCIPLVFAGERLMVPPRDWSTQLDLLSLQWILDA